MIDYCKLKKIEKEESLFDREYCGVHYWQMVRLNLVRGDESSDNNIEKQRKSILQNNLLYCMKRVVPDFIESKKKRKCDILYFDQCSYSQVDDDLHDTYFEYFELEKTYKVYRCYYLKKASRKAGVGVALPLSRYYFFRALSKVFKCFCSDKKEENSIVAIEAALKKHGSTIKLEPEIKKAVMLFKAYKPFYDRLLVKRNPKAVFVVCHYDETLFPLYQACKEKKIPVIELQHGLASGVNAYTYDDRSESGKQLPSHIFSYGDIWDEYIKMPCTTKVVSIGNAFLENRKNKYSNIKMDDKKVVIYSFPDERERLVELAIYIAKNMPDYSLLLKLHPREMQYHEDIKKRIKGIKNLEIVDKKKELYELLSSARHHIAISSTVLYEASIYPSYRYVYSRPVYIERMQPLIDAGLAVAFNDKNEILKLIERNRDNISLLQNDNPMWKLGAVKNANSALERIINGRL